MAAPAMPPARVSTAARPGRTWPSRGSRSVRAGPDLQAANPWLSFAPNGDLYSIGPGLPAGRWQMLVNKSTDGGLTWSGPIQVKHRSGNPADVDDKPSITADPSNPNYVYATWARFNNPPSGGQQHGDDVRPLDRRRPDVAARAVHPHGLQRSDLNWGHQIVVLPDGTLIDAFTEGQFTNNHQARADPAALHRPRPDLVGADRRGRPAAAGRSQRPTAERPGDRSRHRPGGGGAPDVPVDRGGPQQRQPLRGLDRRAASATSSTTASPSPCRPTAA